MFQRNDSAEYDGWFGMYTGEKEFSQVGQIFSWNQSTTIRWPQEPHHLPLVAEPEVVFVQLESSGGGGNSRGSNLQVTILVQVPS